MIGEKRSLLYMSETESPRPIRGAIKTDIGTSTDVLLAGEEFSIFLTVHNPFESPLTLHRISTYLPAEFLDVDRYFRELEVKRLQEELTKLQELADEYEIDIPTPSSLPKKKYKLKEMAIDLFKIIFGINPMQLSGSHIGPSVARDMTSTELIKAIVGINLFPLKLEFSKTNKTAIADETSRTALKKRIKNEIANYKEAMNSVKGTGTEPKELQPGNSAIRTFTVKSKKRIWFKPSTYKLSIEIEYEIGGVHNTDTTDFTIHVRASVASLILGALLGGLGGWFVSRGPDITFDLANLVSCGSSLFLAVMAVILLGRKKDMQPLVTVEDFWGGAATGFIVAYSGPKLISTLIGASQ